MGHPTIAELRTAIRDVRSAPHGRAALRFLRPRRVAPLSGDRAPLLLVLLLARMEHRLAWLGPSGFAIVEPPLLSPRRSSPSRAARWLRFVDRHWSRLVLAVPSLLIAALGSLSGLTFGPLGVLFAVLLMVLYVLVLMLTSLLWQVFFPERAHSGSIPEGTEWTMSLFHQRDDHRVDELLGLVDLSLRRAVLGELFAVTTDRDVQFKRPRVSARLRCPREAITTDFAQDRVGSESPRVVVDADGSSVRVFDEREGDVPRAPSRITFFRWFLLAIVLLVLFLAFMVAQQEGGRLNYGDTLLWLLYQFVWRSPPGIEATSNEATVISLLLMPVLPLTLAVAFVAVQSKLKQERARTEQMRSALKRVVGTTRILLVTVATVERKAVLDALEKHTGKEPKLNFGYSVPVFNAGVVGNTEVFVIQVQQGVTAASGVITAASAAIEAIHPHYAVITGICWGLRPDEQSFGDICVATRVRDLDHVKLVESDGVVTIIDRGENEAPSPIPLHAFQAVEHAWSRSAGTRVHFGPMLATNALVNSRKVAEELRRRYADAVAADMEGAGFRAAAKAANVNWSLVKAICDFGKDKNDLHQQSAATNSAEFVLSALVLGAFDSTVEDRLGH